MQAKYEMWAEVTCVPYARSGTETEINTTEKKNIQHFPLCISRHSCEIRKGKYVCLYYRLLFQTYVFVLSTSFVRVHQVTEINRNKHSEIRDWRKNKIKRNISEISFKSVEISMGHFNNSDLKIKVKVTLRLAVYRQSVRLGAELLKDYDQRFFLVTEPLRP
jgi:hypothetical protein